MVEIAGESPQKLLDSMMKNKLENPLSGERRCYFTPVFLKTLMLKITSCLSTP
jgi:hypothetical protein